MAVLGGNRMNVLATLDEELKGKNWDKGTKARYLYLRCCELFSFDSRYNYYKELERFEDEIIGKLRLRDRKINLEDVTDFRVVCTVYSREIYRELLSKLIGIPCNIIGTGHIYPEFSEPQEVYKVKADATKSDLARVKMGLKTEGYKPIDCNFYDAFEKRLDQMDFEIGYKKDAYANEYLKQQAEKYIQKEMVHNDSKTDITILLNRMYEVKRLFESYGSYSVYSDAKFCINHLLDLYFNSHDTDNLSLFQFRGDFEIDFVNLISLKTDTDKAYFMLGKEQNYYSFHEIEESDAKSYKKDMRCRNRCIMLR